MIEPKLQKTLAKLPAFKRVVVACSGGPDSVALAHGLWKLGYSVTLAHLNHSLRGKASDGDAEFVHKLAKTWGVPCVIKKARISRKGNLEANAREARYQFLEDVRQGAGAKLIAVAHHRDDQVETILMNQQRGAGLRGLRGLESARGRIIRPLLGVTKADILKYLAAHQLAYRHDASNDDTHFTRNRLRHEVIPALKETDSRAPQKLLAAGRRAGLKLGRLESEAKRWLSAELKNGQFSQNKFNRAAKNLRGEILIQLIGPHDLYKKNIDHLIDFISKAQTGKKMTVKNQTFLVQYGQILLHKNEKLNRLFKPKNKQKAVSAHGLSNKKFVQVDGGHAGRLRAQTFISKKRLTAAKLNLEKWSVTYRGTAPLFVRLWKPGDRFQPSGMTGSKKLQDFFTDAKIPRAERHTVPLIVDRHDRIVCVGGFRFAEGAAHLKDQLTFNRAL